MNPPADALHLCHLVKTHMLMCLRLVLFLTCLLAWAGRIQAQPLRELTPALLLPAGQSEVKFFHNLYSQTAWYNAAGRRIAADERSTFFTAIGEWRVGWKPRWNAGLMTFFRSVRYDRPQSNPLAVFRWGNDGLTARTALTHLGPTVRWLPLPDSRTTSLKASLLLPLAPDLQGTRTGRRYLEHDGYQLWIQALYDRRLAEEWQLYAEAALWIRLDRRFRTTNSYAVVPLRAFLSWLPREIFTAYTFVEWSGVPTEPLRNYYLQWGAGMKWYPHRRFELELMASDFFAGAQNGAGWTANLGWRYVW